VEWSDAARREALWAVVAIAMVVKAIVAMVAIAMASIQEVRKDAPQVPRSDWR
jgi:hypothetical protein